MATAYSLAQVFKRPLIVIHAQTGAKAATGAPCEALLQEFGVRLSEDVPVTCIGENSDPTDAVVLAVARFHPSILVAGVKRASETPGPHGTAFALLARSRVPVLCVPPAIESGEPQREAAVPAEAV